MEDACRDPGKADAAPGFGDRRTRLRKARMIFNDNMRIPMKNVFKCMLLASAALIVVSCGPRDRASHLPGSHSAAYEVIVTASPEIWNGPLGDTLRNVMQAPVPMLNSYEPQFDILRIMPNQYSDYIKRHRNTIVLNVNPEYTEPRMVPEYDRYASPQMIIYLLGPDQATLAQYLHENAYYLRTIFNMAERDRFVSGARRSPSVTLQTQVKEKFGFDIGLLRGFTLGNSLDDFMWLRYEHPQSSQGVIIYTYPYGGPEDFTLEALMARRDQFTGLVPGEVDGSHMITYREMEPELTHLRIKGRYWAEMRGYWDVYKDFMGGPFVSYSTVDTESNRVVTLDFYVYSPSPYKPKRNLLRQLESIVHSVKFPSDGKVVQSDEPARSVEIEEITVE